MSTLTIDFGIDLGTTNSEIARLNGTEIEIFRNAEGFEFTPSAVWIDKQGKTVVGRIAKEWCERDPENAFQEFKRNMGTVHEYTFAHSGRAMKPEELSAEVVKALRADVQRRRNELIQAAVITTPADFDLPACEATRRAASLAGLDHVLLLQEPVAAAQAYSFDREDDNIFWLVYDFGGGTFDAAIIQVHDGLVQVVGNGGDNRLGGKNLDWAIVEELFIPALTREHRLTDFCRSQPQWRGAIAKLKGAAEAAKMRLSSVETTEVMIDLLCHDDRREPVEFAFDLKRTDLERLAAPFIRRSINICRETLAVRRLASGDIAKVILVGGPTLMPLLREQLQDSSEGLGIPLEFNVDPLTVVARGAAIFAGSQRLPDGEWRRKVKVGQFGIKLDYAPVGPDTDPPVAGEISAGEGVEQDFTGFTIEFENSDMRPPWRSGKVSLNPQGKFMTTVSAEKGKANTFRMELRDPTGALQQLKPKNFQITVKGAGQVQITLPHSIGVALADNRVAVFFDKDTVIPARKTQKLRTAIAIRRGEAGALLRVPVVEGNRSRADRNRLIGTLTIPGIDKTGRERTISRDVPAGSEIEVTIDLDQSRLIRTEAFLPILHEEFDNVLPMEGAIPDASHLAERLHKAKEHLDRTRKQAEQLGENEADRAIRSVDSEDIVRKADDLIPLAAGGDTDAAGGCQNLLNSLESALDDIEDILEWPALVKEANEAMEHTRKMLEICEPWDESGKETLRELKRDFEGVEFATLEAMEHRDPDLLRQRTTAVVDLGSAVKRLNPAWWAYLLRDLNEMKDEMTDQALAVSYLAKGEQAIQNNDFDGLKSAVRGLVDLVPKDKTPKSLSDVTL